MEAGLLNRRITLERFTEGRDELNELVKTWGTLAKVWANKLDISDVERIAAQEQGATVTTRFQIRFSPMVEDINPKDRVNFEGKIYDITGVKEIGVSEGIELTTAYRPDLTSS